jgi:hypothetical protein
MRNASARRWRTEIGATDQLVRRDVIDQFSSISTEPSCFRDRVYPYLGTVLRSGNVAMCAVGDCQKNDAVYQWAEKNIEPILDHPMIPSR